MDSGERSDPERSELVDVYWRYYRASNGSRQERLAADRYRWAYETVSEIVEIGQPDAVEILVELSEAESDDFVALSNLGAGPIEQLLCHHADEFIDQIDSAARQSSSFRMALRCAWYDASLPTEIVHRVRRFGEPY